MVKNREEGVSGVGEVTPLLGGASARSLSVDRSSETLTDPHGRNDGEEDLDKANQQVGVGRALLIILSLWGLIFLQG